MIPFAGAPPGPDAPHPHAEADPLAAILLALRDAWGFGLTAMRSLSEAASGGPTAAPEDILAAALRSVPGAGQDAAGNMAPAMLQAASAASASALRYWQDLAGIGARHQPLVLQAIASRSMDPDARAAEGQAMAEAFRAALREVGDAAMLEARRLQRDLEEIGAEVAEAAAHPAAEAPFRRRWKAKE